MTQILQLLRALFKAWKKRPAYAIIYDSWSTQADDYVDDMYEVFSTPEEAIEMFTTAYGSDPESVKNPRLVLILDPIPGQWSKNQ